MFVTTAYTLTSGPRVGSRKPANENLIDEFLRDAEKEAETRGRAMRTLNPDLLDGVDLNEYSSSDLLLIRQGTDLYRKLRVRG